MRKRKVIFRADGNAKIGLGHVIRSMALAEMLKNDFECVLATRFFNEKILEATTETFKEIIRLPSEGDQHFRSFLELLDGSEVVVLDNYFYKSDYQKQIKDIGNKLVCIDDTAENHQMADIVINHGPSIKPSDYSKEAYTQLLLGFEYTLLRSEFLGEDKCVKKENQQKNILLCMGGADPENISQKILSSLNRVSGINRIDVILGCANQNEINVSSINTDVKVHNCVSAVKMKTFMEDSYFGIFPASSISIEAIALRLPIICGYFVQNQEKLYSGIINNKLGLGIGDWKDFNIDSFISACDSLINDETLGKKLVLNQEKHLDKNSNKRLLQHFKQL